MQRFAIEADCLARPPLTGIARYTRQLGLGLDQLAEQVSPSFRTTMMYRWSSRGHRHALPTGRNLHRSVWHRGRWPLARLYDAVLCTYNRAPDWPTVPRVVTIHDLHAELGLGLPYPDWLERELSWRRQLLDGVSEIICVSAATRDDLLRFYPSIRREQTHVVHLGVEGRFSPATKDQVKDLRRRLSLDRPFLLFVGLRHPNKNLTRLLAAYRHCPATQGVDLVIAGPVNDLPIEVTEALRDERGDRRVRLTGYVADDDLPTLYTAAAAFMFPSLYEGFGLPILEAMRCETPVLTGDRGSCPEVAAGHAVIVDPYDVESISNGIYRALDMDAGMRASASDYAATMTWERTAKGTLDVLRLAAQGR